MEIARGGSPRPIKSFLTNREDGINWIKIGDTEKNKKYIDTVKEKIIPEGVSKSRLVHKGDFLLTNSMSFGRPYILNVDGCIHDGWLVLSNVQNAFDKDFLYYLLSSKFAYYQFCESVSGAVVKNLNSDKVSIARFALPPLNEQKRIVDLIEKVVPLVEKYDFLESELNSINITIKDRLKKSILQYAIEGKLVEQDPNDEPVSVLLDRIHDEKEKLIKDGKIKRNKNESIIFRRDNSYYEKLQDNREICIDDLLQFNIPSTWEWCRLDSIFQHNTGKALNSSNSEGSRYKYLTTSNVYWNSFVLDKLKEMPFKENELEKCMIKKGDLLVCEGGDIGRAAIWPYEESFCIQNHLHRLRPYSNLYIKYFYYLFYLYKNCGLIGGKGIGIQGLSTNALGTILFPIAPVNEQIKIVEKYEEIMKILR